MVNCIVIIFLFHCHYPLRSRPLTPNARGLGEVAGFTDRPPHKEPTPKIRIFSIQRTSARYLAKLLVLVAQLDKDSKRITFCL
jgi:hypothetical protein